MQLSHVVFQGGGEGANYTVLWPGVGCHANVEIFSFFFTFSQFSVAPIFFHSLQMVLLAVFF